MEELDHLGHKDRATKKSAAAATRLLQQAAADVNHYRAQRESERRGPPQGGPQRSGDDGIIDSLLLLRASGAWVELVTDDRNLFLRAHNEGFIVLPTRRAGLRLTRLVALAHTQLAGGQQQEWGSELYLQEQRPVAEEAHPQAPHAPAQSMQLAQAREERYNARTLAREELRAIPKKYRPK